MYSKDLRASHCLLTGEHCDSLLVVTLTNGAWHLLNMMMNIVASGVSGGRQGEFITLISVEWNV